MGGPSPPPRGERWGSMLWQANDEAMRITSRHLRPQHAATAMRPASQHLACSQPCDAPHTQPPVPSLPWHAAPAYDEGDRAAMEAAAARQLQAESQQGAGQQEQAWRALLPEPAGVHAHLPPQRPHLQGGCKGRAGRGWDSGGGMLPAPVHDHVSYVLDLQPALLSAASSPQLSQHTWRVPAAWPASSADEGSPPTACSRLWRGMRRLQVGPDPEPRGGVGEAATVHHSQAGGGKLPLRSGAALAERSPDCHSKQWQAGRHPPPVSAGCGALLKAHAAAAGIARPPAHTRWSPVKPTLLHARCFLAAAAVGGADALHAASPGGGRCPGGRGPVLRHQGGEQHLERG